MPVDSLNHFNEHGDAVMVNVGEKNVTHRFAKAESFVKTSEEVLSLIKSGGVSKGDVLGIARIAGIMGAKKNFRTHSTLS